MSLIAYIPRIDGTGGKLLEAAVRALPEGEIELFNNTDELAIRLNQPLEVKNQALLWAGSRVDLVFFVQHEDWFRDFKIVLILQDRDKQTLSDGLRLRPRYVGYADSDFEEVTRVLHNMLMNGSAGNSSDLSVPGLRIQINSRKGAVHGETPG